MHVDASGRVASTCRPLGRPALFLRRPHRPPRSEEGSMTGDHEALPALLMPESTLRGLVDRLPLAPRVDRAGSSTPRRSHRG
jgi:hypothetical protein